MARLDRVPTEDIRAQLTALQRVAAVRSEDSTGRDSRVLPQQIQGSPCAVAGLDGERDGPSGPCQVEAGWSLAEMPEQT